MPNDQVLIGRELLSRLLSRADTTDYQLACASAREILAQPTPVDGVEVVAWLDGGEDCPDATASRKVMMDWANCGYSFKPLITLAAHQAEVARLRDDRDSHQRECIKALAGYDSLRGDAAALVKKCLDEERECWIGDSRQPVHMALDDAYARVLIALSQQATP